ncbi:hypothetical protein OUZ56_029299 [Daphnia magna]|uniref:Syndetin C-terminal domain-containing protein n=1 Tax=Daphnia magna TaxID=35525 RepID=A0ABR0B6E7_9CRUS|nr:hypothetical protein OUZ56_029299 [Daphnia magna]
MFRVLVVSSWMQPDCVWLLTINMVLSDYDSSVLCVCYPQILPPEIYNILWDQILRACYHTLLDGFSAVRKCTNEGRALMQLDFRHFQVKVESLTRLRPLLTHILSKHT